MTSEIERLVEDAKGGDKAALEALVGRVQDRVFGMAVRMLADPVEAEDATQEILIKVVTNLAAFRGDSAFTTWVHRIAVNHLLNARARTQATPMSFEMLAGMIDAGLAEQSPPAEPTDRVLTEEVRITCTEAMLTALDREHRIAFILGEIFELPGDEAASLLEITPAAFRQRASRARRAIEDFMQKRCGVYDASNPCRCSIQVPYAVRTGMLDPDRLRFGALRRDDRPLDEVLGLLDVGAIYRSHSDYAAPSRLTEALRRALASKKA